MIIKQIVEVEQETLVVFPFYREYFKTSDTYACYEVFEKFNRCYVIHYDSNSVNFSHSLNTPSNVESLYLKSKAMTEEEFNKFREEYFNKVRNIEE